MIQLFAGHRSDGSLLFIGEAERGLQTDCFCPVCRSPLVAKKGDIYEWHFAHQPAQERPECEVGAINLLRQICREVVVRDQTMVLPELKITRERQGPLSSVIRSYERPALTGQITGPVNFQASADQPFAFLQTETGVFAVYSMVHSRPLPASLDGVACVGSVILRCPLPIQHEVTLKSSAQAIEYVQSNMLAEWIAQVDGFPSPAQVVFRLDSEINAEISNQYEVQRTRRAAARLLEPAQRMGFVAAPRAADAVSTDPSQPRTPVDSHSVDEAEFSLRMKQARNAHAIYLEMIDQSAWTLLVFAGVARLKPILGRGVFAGWERVMPPDVGPAQVIGHAECYKSLDVEKCLNFLARHAVVFNVGS